MKQRFLRFVSVTSLFFVLLSSCKKSGSDTPDPPPPPPPPPDPGTITLNIPEPKENPLALGYFTDTKVVDVFSIGRTGSNTLATNTAVTVEVEIRPDLIDQLNLAKGTAYEPMPDSIYTSAITRVSDIYTMNLAAGELSKKFSVTINGAKWDVDYEYAMAFIVKKATGGNITSFKDTIITTLSARNKWDGVYTVTGTYSDAIVPAYTGYYPYEWELKTTGPAQCVVIDRKLLGGVPGFLYSTGVGSGSTFYVDFGVVVNFDPATDKITSVVNYFGQPASNTRRAELDPSGANAYNSTTKVVSIKYFMKQPSSVAASPNIRAYFNEQWLYVKSR